MQFFFVPATSRCHLWSITEQTHDNIEFISETVFFFYISQLNSKFVDIEIFPLLFESRDAPIL